MTSGYLSVDDQASIEATVLEFLDRTCSIERAQFTDDGMGAGTREWLTVATGVPFKVVKAPLGLRLDDNWLRPATNSTVTVPKTTDLRLGDRLRDGAVIWLVQTVPIPNELTLYADVVVMSMEGAEDPVGMAASGTDGGNVSFIPSGTIQATNVQDALEELDAASTKFERGTVVTDPEGVGAMDVVVWRAPYPCTCLAVRGFRIGGEGCIIRARRGDLSLNVSDISLVSQSVWVEGLDVQNNVFAPGDALVLEIVQVTGIVSEVTIQAEFRRE